MASAGKKTIKLVVDPVVEISLMAAIKLRILGGKGALRELIELGCLVLKDGDK